MYVTHTYQSVSVWVFHIYLNGLKWCERLFYWDFFDSYIDMSVSSFNWHLKVKFNISHQAVIYLHSIHHNNNMSCSSLTWAWCSLRPTLQWLEFHFPLWTAMLRQGVRSGTLCGLGFCQTCSCFFLWCRVFQRSDEISVSLCGLLTSSIN